MFPQILSQVGDYRTITSGVYSNPNIWQEWNGTNWVSTNLKPSRINNVFIDQGHEVTLTDQEEAHHVYLYSAASPGKKINLQSFELHVYGALRGLNKSSGQFILHGVTSAAVDWIYPEHGKIVFKGNPRVVVDRSSWSASNINSRFTVVFDPGPGVTLTVNAGFKANAFYIKSGTVYQTVNAQGTAACSTFSFNNQTQFNGSEAYGDFVVEANATFTSECSAPLEALIRRSNTTLASLFHLKPNGNLNLLGAQPMMEVKNIILEGNVYYQGGSGVQQMLSSSFSGAGVVDQYHHLYFSGAAQKQIRPYLMLSGNFTFINGGNLLDSNSTLELIGNEDQFVFNWQFTLGKVILNKPSGCWHLMDNLEVKGTLEMFEGKINFHNNKLIINSSGIGGYFYLGGEWLNLKQLTYHGIPAVFTTLNATFPFEDKFQGGIRYFNLLGSTPLGNLVIDFNEIKGANWDPNFLDNDGTPILYQLRSYFKVKTSHNGTNPIELRISARNLIVDQLQDIRVVSDGQHAPGSHLESQEPEYIWARRSLTFNDLNEHTFTLGSHANLSVLPLQWILLNATVINDEIRVKWEVAAEKNSEIFQVHQSIGGLGNFKCVASVNSKGNSEGIQMYETGVPLVISPLNTFFQIEQIDHLGNSTFSEVFRLSKEYSMSNKYYVWPNPYEQGQFQLLGLDESNLLSLSIKIFHSSGIVLFNGGYEKFLDFPLETLKNGLYFIQITDQEKLDIFKLIKR